MFNEGHLKRFKQAYPHPPELSGGAKHKGRNPRHWFAAISRRIRHPPVPDLPDFASREALLAMSRDGKQDLLALCISILAWGEMRVSNGSRLFESSDTSWLSLSEDLRAGKLSRAEAYASFTRLRAEKRMPGLGPAYFTKLIYFLPPAEHKGYIMDQWLGCSINLLLGHELVLLNESKTWKKVRGEFDCEVSPDISSWVSDQNTPAHYEDFCRAIESLSEQLSGGWTPEKTELALMAEGRNKHEWRRYVIDERRKRFGYYDDRKTCVNLGLSAPSRSSSPVL